ncbi:MAG: hypothetical protein ACRC67_37625 [Inquilinus sp.]|uniref:hypothetical protein n=1 Tax=Inquilinus sp. TaxID=1932117 RepID=UPI003F2B9608
MKVANITAANWRADYPSDYPDPQIKQPWELISFDNNPIDYMNAILQDSRTSFRYDNRKLVGTGHEPWWISEWLDYGTSGREPYMGLTKERGPSPGDLSPTNKDGYQVWAVGFYNHSGAAVLGDIFAEPCNPSLPVALKFPFDTVSIKFLFTDASTDEVNYLKGAPAYDALIDAAGSGSTSLPVEKRTKQPLHLLQVDIAIKDSRAADTGWVFGTFAWIGPPKGDQLFDNLVPVSLQWGNDPKVYDTNLHQSWTNPALAGVTYGWEKRPTMGFQGRANGPADNIRSSCLSCHAASRTPRSTLGLLNSRFNMADLANTAKVKDHVDTWFQNLKGGQLFQPAEPATSALDYSLQLEAATFRMCRACAAGDLQGVTPILCRSSGFYNRPMCSAPTADFARKLSLELTPPPRQ